MPPFKILHPFHKIFAMLKLPFGQKNRTIGIKKSPSCWYNPKFRLPGFLPPKVNCFLGGVLMGSPKTFNNPNSFPWFLISLKGMGTLRAPPSSCPGVPIIIPNNFLLLILA